MDAYWWTDGPSAVRAVMRSIIFEWRRQYANDDLVLIARAGSEPSIASELGDVRVIGTRLWPHGLAVPLTARLMARKIQADAVLTHNFAAPTANSFVYLHDLMFLDHPEWFLPSERMYFSLMRPLARRSTAIFATSRTESARIRRHTMREPICVGLGISETLLTQEPSRPVELVAKPGTFLLTVGRLNARKNLRTILRAAELSQFVGPEYPLIVVGEPDGLQDDNGDLKDLQQSGCVQFLGYIEESELAWLYRNARASVFASLDEGFGMPPLESLALGTPTIVSRIEVFQETVGDVARFFPPTSPQELARIFDEVLQETNKTDEHGNAALRRVGTRFRWRHIVPQIREAIESHS